MSETPFTCPVCNHGAPAHGVDPREEITRCDVCGARIVYGEPAAVIVVEPSNFGTDARPAFLLRMQDPATRADVHTVKLDPGSAFTLAQAIIAMVRP